jgi:hypothetical protein
LEPNFTYCILTELSQKKFVGQICDGKINTGTIIAGKNKLILESGENDSYYGKISNLQKKSIYTGGIFEQKKEGYGVYFEGGKKRFEGFFVEN